MSLFTLDFILPASTPKEKEERAWLFLALKTEGIRLVENGKASPKEKESVASLYARAVLAHDATSESRLFTHLYDSSLHLKPNWRLEYRGLVVALCQRTSTVCQRWAPLGWHLAKRFEYDLIAFFRVESNQGPLTTILSTKSSSAPLDQEGPSILENQAPRLFFIDPRSERVSFYTGPRDDVDSMMEWIYRLAFYYR